MGCSKLLKKIYHDFPGFLEFLSSAKIKCLNELKIPDLQLYFNQEKISDNQKQSIIITYTNCLRKLENIQCNNQCDNNIHKDDELLLNLNNLITIKSSEYPVENQDETTKEVVIPFEKYYSYLEDEYYYCSDNVSFRTNDVMESIYKYIHDHDIIYIDRLYNHLKKKYNVKTFNRNHLIQLLNKDFYLQSGKIYFNKFKYKDNILRGNEKSDYLYNIFKIFYELTYIYGFNVLTDIFSKDIDLIVLYASSFSNKESLINLSNEKKSEIKSLYFIFKNLIRDEVVFNESFSIERYNSWFQINKKQIYFFYVDYKQYKNLFTRVIPINYHLKLKYLVSDELNIILANNGICTVEELIINFYKVLIHIKDDFYSEIDALTLLLSIDIKATIKDQFVILFKKNTLEILELRASGFTLEEVGNKYRLTRERIRQIEANTIKKILSKEKYIRETIYLCLSYTNNNLYITKSELLQIFGNTAHVFIYCLKRFESNIIQYIDELGIISVCEYNWYNEIENYLSDCPNVLSKEEVDIIVEKFIYKFKSLDICLPEEIIYQAIETIYNLQGNIYHKQRLGLIDKYKIIIKKHFPNGISIYSNSEMDNFRKYYKFEFNDDDIYNKSNRTIYSRITDFTTLIDKGKYDLIEKIPIIDEYLLLRISNFIESSDSCLMYKQIFYKFELELIKNKVINQYILQGLLKNHFAGQYYFTKDYISKDVINSNYSQDIIEFVNEFKGPFTISQVKHRFPYLNNSLIEQVLINDDNYISLFNKRWISGINIIISPEIKNQLFKTIMEMTKDGNIISSSDLHDYLVIKNPIFMEEHNIENRHQLFGYIRFLFKDSFNFKKPYLSRLGIELLSGKERLYDFISSNDELSITELRNFADENSIIVYSMMDYLDSINDEYYRVDYDLIVRKHLVDVDDVKVRNIEQILHMVLLNKRGVNLSKISYDLFPQLNYKWNEYLLSSIIKSCSNNYRILNTTTFYNTTKFIVVRNSLDVKNYDEYVRLIKEGKKSGVQMEFPFK